MVIFSKALCIVYYMYIVIHDMCVAVDQIWFIQHQLWANGFIVLQDCLLWKMPVNNTVTEPTRGKAEHLLSPSARHMTKTFNFNFKSQTIHLFIRHDKVYFERKYFKVLDLDPPLRYSHCYQQPARVTAHSEIPRTNRILALRVTRLESANTSYSFKDQY